SKAHTAVKIDTQYSNSVVHVNDASRAVTVVGDLLQKETSEGYKKSIKQDYNVFREKFLNRSQHKSYKSIEAARKNKFRIDWETFKPIKPKELGIQVIEDMDLEKLVDFIDWTPFFRSWELHGKYPDILGDDVIGEQATELFADAQKMLKEVIEQKKLKGKGIFGLFPANSVNDDIEVQGYTNTEQGMEIQEESGNFVFRTLRQQLERREGVPDYALADFIAPKESGKQDYIGCFCVTTGFGTDEISEKYRKDLDDYNSILIKALSDRLAEAFAEYLHKQIRIKFWGYAPNENLANEDLIDEKYRGIRPAPGYPACPDHLEKLTIWDMLQVEEKIGVKLTDSLAMWPASSVSGYYFANPEARYFGLGKIKEDQVEDFAKRKGISLEKATKWLAPNIVEA
ncbi:MAG: methionine synthase, partial [Pricia sp.]|nr:methionine synthase [Pricia sp.]